PDPFQTSSALRVVGGDGQGGATGPASPPGRGTRGRLGGLCRPAPYGTETGQTLPAGGAALRSCALPGDGRHSPGAGLFDRPLRFGEGEGKSLYRPPGPARPGRFLNGYVTQGCDSPVFGRRSPRKAERPFVRRAVQQTWTAWSSGADLSFPLSATPSGG